MSRSTRGAAGTRRVLGALLATVAAGLVGGLGTLGATAAPAAPPPADDGLPLDVFVTAVTPQVLQPGQDLTVSVRVHNGGQTPVAQPRVALSLDRSSYIGRYSLDRWRAAAPTDPVGREVAVSDLPAALAPGEQATVDLVVPASQVRLPTRASSWGARGLAVTVADGADPAGTRLGVARTFALWFPPQDVNATQVSVLVPVVGPAVDVTSDAWVPELVSATAPGGRLTDVLDATGAAPGVTWLLDPWLLDAADQGGYSTATWADSLVAAMTDREVQLLPYLDADVTALAHAARGDLVAAAVRRSDAAARTRGLPDSARVSVALPAVGEPDLVTAALAGETSDLALVVGPGTLPPPAVLTYTPSGRTTVSAGGSPVTVLVPDARLSAALVTGAVDVNEAVVGRVSGAADEDATGAQEVADEAGDEDDTAGADADDDADPSDEALTAAPATLTPATAAQDLLAELAVITRERPNDSRHVLVTVPRDWEPDVDVVTAQLAALASAPWVRTQPVSALIGLADPEIDRGTLPARAVDDTEMIGAEVTALTTALQRRAELVGMLAEPAEALGHLELETLAPLSVAWRADAAGRAAVIEAARERADTLADAVTVSPTTEDGINVVSTSAELPVNVSNALREPVSVTVRLRPDDPRLRADDAVPVTVPAESQVLVRVPVHAVQSADVQVTVEVRTPDGAIVDDDTSFLVRVRAEWEGIGTAILGSLLALGVVLGIVRTVRRGRTARRAAPEPDAGPDALSPEQVEEEVRP